MMSLPAQVPYYDRPMKGASTIAADLSVPERVLLFCVGSPGFTHSSGATGVRL
jgi:hypothetical protein